MDIVPLRKIWHIQNGCDVNVVRIIYCTDDSLSTVLEKKNYKIRNEHRTHRNLCADMISFLSFIRNRTTRFAGLFSIILRPPLAAEKCFKKRFSGICRQAYRETGSFTVGLCHIVGIWSIQCIFHHLTE